VKVRALPGYLSHSLLSPGMRQPDWPASVSAVQCALVDESTDDGIKVSFRLVFLGTVAIALLLAPGLRRSGDSSPAISSMKLVNYIPDIPYRFHAARCERRVPEASLRDDVPFSEYGADSLDLVEFVFAVQEQFKVNFESNEFEGLKTLDDLIGAVTAKLNSTS
jgi:acyl carrier protein